MDILWTLWLHSHVISFTTEKEPVHQFAKTQEPGVNRHQHAMQVRNISDKKTILFTYLKFKLLHNQDWTIS